MYTLLVYIAFQSDTLTQIYQSVRAAREAALLCFARLVNYATYSLLQ